MANMLVNDRSLPAHCSFGCCDGLTAFKMTHSKKQLRRLIRRREKRTWRREELRNN